MVRYTRFPFQDADDIQRLEKRNAELRRRHIGTKAVEFEFDGPQVGSVEVTIRENGTSDSTIMAIAGHVSRRMLERYSHVRMEAKRTAMEALALR
jgi:hypothetical protein